MRDDHYCVIISQGKPVDNMYFDNELVAAYYYRVKYKIKNIRKASSGNYKVTKGPVVGEILKVQLDKRVKRM